MTMRTEYFPALAKPKSHAGLAIAAASLFLFATNGACSPKKQTADKTPPPPPAPAHPEPQSFPSDPHLQRLVDAGARISFRAASRVAPRATTVEFDGKALSHENLSEFASVEDLSFVWFRGCRFEAGALGALQRLSNQITLIFDRCALPIGGLGDLDGCLGVGAIQILYDTPVDDAALAGLKTLPNLWDFEVSSPDVSLAGIEFLKDCPQLVELHVVSARLDDAGLARIVDGHELRWLDVAGTAITDEGMKIIGRQTKLRRLSIAGCLVTDAGLAHLSGLTDLTALGLGATKITDQGLAALANLKKLRELSVPSTAVTDRGVAHLAGLTHLRSIGNYGTAITRAGTDRAFGAKRVTLDVNH